jgi:hypothetical protein
MDYEFIKNIKFLSLESRWGAFLNEDIMRSPRERHKCGKSKWDGVTEFLVKGQIPKKIGNPKCYTPLS